MESTASFGYWLRRQRKALDLTQQALAERVGCSVAAIKKIEGDERKPSRQIAERMAAVLGVPADQRGIFLEVARGLRPVDQLSLAHEPTVPSPTQHSVLPSGTVTFLYTDIEGSTKLAQHFRDIWEALRKRHHAILREVIEAHNGHVFQIVGDAFCAAFPTAGDALRAAVKSQVDLQAEDWGETPIRVRMGIHTGKAEVQEDGHYQGYITLSHVQRLMSAGHGGQVLFSFASQELVQDEVSEGLELRDLGEHRLKDFDRAEHIFQLVMPGLHADFPPLKAMTLIRNNLPGQLTSFVGRGREIAEVKYLLSSTRLVTLTGAGGSGKTRLSIQVANEVLDQHPDGVWMVELAPILDPLLIPRTTAIAIGLRDEPERPVIDMLCDYLREKKMLIILDNCEHLIEACAQLVDTILHACPQIRILASSREALGITGERTYPVPSLTLPNIQHLPPAESLSKYEAVQLFNDRATSAVPAFTLTNENAPSIAQICVRLDGIPLAIELAASKIRALSVKQIAKRLDDRFRLLTSGNRTALPRHQTLQAAIEWSYNLLSTREQILFRRLSVFVNGWILEAAEEVCVGQDDIISYDVLDLLTQLVNKSLVVMMEHSHSGETRYNMLETIRQYAREKLSEADDSGIIRLQHLAYFVTLAERAEPEFYRSDQAFWFNKFADELDNFRLAMEWALMTDSKLGLRLMIHAEDFWGRHDTREVQKWLAQLLKQYRVGDSLRAHTLKFYSWALASGGDLAKAQIIANQSLELSRAISDKHAEAASLQRLGELIALHGDVEQGIPLLEQSLALYRSLGDKLGQASATALLSLNHNDLERSKSFLFESLKLYRELGNLSGIAYCLSQLAHRAIWGGDFVSPIKWLEEARTILHQLGAQREEAGILDIYGSLAYWSGNYQQAVEYFEESKTLYEVSGNFIIDALWSRVNMAYAILREGNIEHARAQFKICVEGFHGGNSTIGLIYAVEGLASLNMIQGDSERAARLFAWADAVRDKIDDHRPPVEQASVERDLAVIHSKLSDTEYSKFSAEGRAMSTEQAIAYALDGLQ